MRLKHESGELHELREQLRVLYKMEAKMANELQNLQDAVKANGATVDQAVALLQQLAANQGTGGVAPADVQAVADQVAAQNSELAAAIAAAPQANGLVVNASGQLVAPYRDTNPNGPYYIKPGTVNYRDPAANTPGYPYAPTVKAKRVLGSVIQSNQSNQSGIQSNQNVVPDK